MMEKQRMLEQRMQELTREKLVIAFSGGVDSSLLLKLAARYAEKNGTKVYALTISTRLQPVEDAQIARQVAEECGAIHVLLQLDESRNPHILMNEKDRCYWCKKYLFGALKQWAKERGIITLLEGSNADDRSVYRPGRRAVQELGVLSPLEECEITKEEVRNMAQTLGISVAGRPSAPCMATRFPYGTPLDFEAMGRLEQGETCLKRMGFSIVRLRLHGEILRLEIEPEKFALAMEKRKEILQELKKLGFSYLTLDLEGFRSGSMDEVL